MKAVAVLLFAAATTTHIIPVVNAWGAAGHEIIATIAEIHLYPSALEKLCDILPAYANCHLAPVASWADKVRMHMHWSGPLHFVNGYDDHPPQNCTFGETGWMGKPGQNVLSAVQNVTGWLRDEKEGAEEALKFLVHFMGDLHQPLHLAGREKGGNGVKVKFDNRVTNLHKVWDTSLIAKSLRTIPRNYTRPLPYKRIESVLKDTIYDPYVRQIMYEGIFDRFEDQLDKWILCPPVDGTSQDSFWAYQLIGADEWQNQILLKGRGGNRDRSPNPTTDDATVCPFAWSSPVHQLNCDIVWPPNIDDEGDSNGIWKMLDEWGVTQHYLELDTPEYVGRIKREFLVERLLSMGGIRLAAVLNYLFANKEDVAAGLLYRLAK